MRWEQRKHYRKPDKDETIVQQIADMRGVKDLGEWLNPPERYVHDPYLLLNIDTAVEKIIKAIHLGEKIVIMLDVDADGICSGAIMYNYLKDMVEEDKLDYIHAQRSHGHGLETVLKDDKSDSDERYVKYLPEDTDLLIIVDSSSNSVKECKTVSDSGTDIVIIDHHHMDKENPYATIVNCQAGDYPNKHLSGSAMTYKVCQVMDDYMAIERADMFIDLCAIGLISDMMNVRDNENRHLIYHGLDNIQNFGLVELFKQQKVELSNGLTTTDIAFKVSPVVNACSRFDKIELAVNLFLTNKEGEAKLYVKEMIEMNDNRKSQEKEVVEDAMTRVNDENNVAVLIDNEITSGFRGLVAMQLVEKLNKPVFVVKYDEEKDSYFGSARSLGILPLKSMCEDTGLFSLAQGHEGAFGIGFKSVNLNKIMEYFNESIEDEDLIEVIEYDLEVPVDEITHFDIIEVEKFSKICGQGVPQPRFKITGLIVEEGHTKKLGDHCRAVMGKNKETVKIHCEYDDSGFALMKFRSNDQYALEVEERFYSGDHFIVELEAVGTLNLNKFYNFGIRQLVVTPQLFLDDYRIV